MEQYEKPGIPQISDLKRWIGERKEELFALLGDLIRIDSQNFGSRGNEEACARYVAELCRGLGLETDLYTPLDLPDFESHPDYLPGRALENRYNVTARWRGADGKDALMLMGHLDTVPVGDPALWTVDPLSGEVRDGKIWGRGACDDKYALAAALFVIRILKDHGFSPRSGVLFTAYCDEENGGSHGALASCLRYPCGRIVNMDCKNFEIWHCASGGQVVSYRFHSTLPADSSGPAARAIAPVMDEIDRFGRRRTEELAANPFYSGTVIPGTALRYMGARAGDDGSSDLGSGEVRFCFYTERTKEEIWRELRGMEETLAPVLAQLGITGDGFVPATRFFHYMHSDPCCEAIRDMQKAASEVSGRKLHVCGSCLSDLSVILKYGSPDAFGFGIGRDFDAYGGAHQPDEHISCGDLEEYAGILAAYLVRTVSQA